ncbi:hypothetical protein [Mucilaginibacter sp. UR6-11]|uniref:hypothetical protein n=1 Tax=Mucilaginibacter sp. UR6-11 TaxID=1435644 RepID=UPI001E5DD3EA|nr:hypothetical protein [Mucilaginibacter sp. UR6-11]MCC8425056.1 hypothetical protein [Mucilaginibacter sp. UR6-11]
MKALRFTLIIPLLLFAISCKKSANNPTASVTTDEAMDMAVGAISANSFGFASVADNISANAQNVNSVNGGGQAVNSTGTASVHQACGTTVADSLNFNGSNSAVTFTAFYKYMRTLNCNANNQPDNLINSITFHGSFDGPRLSSTDSGTSTVTIGGLSSSATNFVINGTYTRNGAFNSKVGSKASGNSTVVITASNVTLSKPGRAVVSGSAVITVSGTAPSGAFNFTGNLVFNGNNQATLTIGTNVYLVNLLTGAYTKK